MADPTFNFNVHSLNKYGAQILPGMTVTWYSHRYEQKMKGFVHAMYVKRERSYNDEKHVWQLTGFSFRAGIEVLYPNDTHYTKISMSVKNLNPVKQ